MTTSIVPPDDKPPDRPCSLWAKLAFGFEFRVDLPGGDLVKAALDWIKRQFG